MIGRIRLVLVGFTLFFCWTTAAQKTQKNPAVGVVDEFTSAYNSKNLEKLVSLYASDAIMVSESGIAEGREAIQARLSVGVRKGNTIAELIRPKVKILESSATRRAAPISSVATNTSGGDILWSSEPLVHAARSFCTTHCPLQKRFSVIECR